MEPRLKWDLKEATKWAHPRLGTREFYTEGSALEKARDEKCEVTGGFENGQANDDRGCLAGSSDVVVELGENGDTVRSVFGHGGSGNVAVACVRQSKTVYSEQHSRRPRRPAIYCIGPSVQYCFVFAGTRNFTFGLGCKCNWILAGHSVWY